MKKEGVAILGATGVVGQKAIRLLEGHPQFYVAEVAASIARRGRRYGDVVRWQEDRPLSPAVGNLNLTTLQEIKSSWVISALPAEIALQEEKNLADQGKYIFSNAGAHRMDPNVPLLIPEVNLDHLELLEKQERPGKIITNSNCLVAVLAPVLAPLLQFGEFTHVSVISMQAISGAGYSGLNAIDILGNLIPHIDKEEEKIVRETHKILGKPGFSASFPMTVHTNRIPVLHGHTVVVHVHFKGKVSVEEVAERYRSNPGLYVVHEDPSFPQPRLHLTSDEMRVHIGRIKQGGGLHVIGMTALAHNLVRGAAGAAIHNLEAVSKRLVTCQSK